MHPRPDSGCVVGAAKKISRPSVDAKDLTGGGGSGGVGEGAESITFKSPSEALPAHSRCGSPSLHLHRARDLQARQPQSLN